ncbi:MAG TPA: STAS-like domain-containing protein [Massilibacterium sp.]|nr:STAS-like domain-containing protein [Massilibacterium sp.]
MFEVVGGPYCVADSDGQEIGDRIKRILQENEKLVLDFKKTTVYASPFFRAAFGDILRQMGNKDTFYDHVEIVNIKPSGQDLIERIVNNIQRTTDDPGYTQELNDILTEELAEI